MFTLTGNEPKENSLGKRAQAEEASDRFYRGFVRVN